MAGDQMVDASTRQRGGITHVGDTTPLIGRRTRLRESSDASASEDEEQESDDGENDEDGVQHDGGVPEPCDDETPTRNRARGAVVTLIRSYDGRVTEHVDLEIPLHTRHASTVRAVAAAVCADLGFSVDAIDDLRLGVNEAVAVLSDVDVDGDGADDARLRITFEPAPSTVTVRCTRLGVDESLADDDLDTLARRILDAVVDEYTIDGGTFTVVKRADAPTA
jgi:hypothetical protein